MIFTELKSTQADENLAAEEYLYRDAPWDDDIFLLWRNEPAVIIGRYQNPWLEVNLPFAAKKNIPILRRITGGGAVFHDTGNLNFSFILNQKTEKTLNFKRFLNPIAEALKSLQLPVIISPRNDLFIGDKKISGNSQHVSRNRVLHHGTLLFKSNLQTLRTSLRPVNDITHSQGTESKRSSVCNLTDIQANLTMDHLQNAVISSVEESFGKLTHRELQEKDKESIEQKSRKYREWEWNFGKSPTFRILHHSTFQDMPVTLELTIRKGTIETCSVINGSIPENLTTALKGICYHQDKLSETSVSKELLRILHPLAP